MFAKHGSAHRLLHLRAVPRLRRLPSRRAGSSSSAARELTRKHGALLIFDEVISGFRFCAGSISRLFGVQPDLATFAKIMGGGMPVAAVAGREDDHEARRDAAGECKFSGGTYSCHPASMLASLTMMEHLVDHEAEIYPRMADLAEKARRAVEEAFAGRGDRRPVHGHGNDALPGGSMGAVHFPYDPSTPCDTPEQTRNPDVVRR